MGPPKRHHIVVYLHIKAKDTAAALISKTTLAEEETDACTWLCTCFAHRIVKINSGLSLSKNCTSPPGFCAHEHSQIDGILANDDGLQRGRIIPTEPLLQSADKTNEYERLSTGTIYAINQWLSRTLKCQKP